MRSGLKRYFIIGLFLLCSSQIKAQTTCTVIKSIPAAPPTTDSADILVNATDPRYSVENARIYDTFNLAGNGSYVEIPPSNPFWINPRTNEGPLNRCGVWGSSGPKILGFSVCVDVPSDTIYYMGFAADNRGTVTIDGEPVIRNIAFSYWNIYKISLTKGIHLVGFSIVNDDGPASIGFEIYNNTKQQIIDAQSYADLNLVFSTKDEVGKPAEQGDASTSYSCPVGYVLNYCSSNGQASPPVCSQFVPVNFTTDFNVTDPPPVCLSAGADITSPQVTAGSVLGLTYTYFKDSLAAIPLDNPDKITTSGTYYIMATANGCSAVKPVKVVVNAVNTTVNTVICLGSSFLGHTKSGVYVDTLVAANGCDSVRTLNLTVKPKVDTTINAFICLGGDYLGHTKNGIYRDTLTTASGCDSLVNINLTVSPNPDFGLISSICPGDSIVLNPGIFSHYRWQDNSTNPTFTAKASGAYWVTVTDKNGCMTTDTIVIRKGHCSTLKIKNTFTPNGDGINDTWIINGLSSYTDCTVFIYSRWGQQVFKSIGYGKPWDGTFNRKELPAGTYYYVINLNDGSPPAGGFITLIR